MSLEPFCRCITLSFPSLNNHVASKRAIDQFPYKHWKFQYLLFKNYQKTVSDVFRLFTSFANVFSNKFVEENWEVTTKSYEICILRFWHQNVTRRPYFLLLSTFLNDRRLKCEYKIFGALHIPSKTLLFIAFLNVLEQNTLFFRAPSGRCTTYVGVRLKWV